MLVDVYEIYASSYIPLTGQGFNPDDAIERFSGESISWDGNAYRRAIISRGDVNLSMGQEQNSCSLTFSNVDRYIATLAQSTVLEGCWLVIRVIAMLSGSFVTDDSRVLFVGKLSKPSTITKKEFSIEARQDFGDINTELPTSKFVADDRNGRLPGDPLFEGFRIVAVSGSFNFTNRGPSTSFFGRLFGRTKKTLATQQYSSLDSTPFGQPVPEVFGSCQMQGIPIAWVDAGYELRGIWAWCKGPVDNIANIVTQGVNPNFNFAGPNLQGPYGPFLIKSHTGVLGGTGTNPARIPSVVNAAVIGGNSGEPEDFPGSGLFSLTAFTGLVLVQGSEFADVIETPPTVVALIRGRLIDLPDTSGAYLITGWSDNPVHIARFILSNDRFVNINSGLIEDSINYLTALHCDGPVLDDSDDQHILISDGDFSVAGDLFHRYRTTGLILPSSSYAGLLTNLVSYWKLSDLVDSVGANTLTNNNAATFVAGKIGNAVNLVAASTQYLSVADNASLDFTSAMTIDGWVKFTTSGGIQTLASKWNFSTDGCWAIQMTAGEIVVNVATTPTDGGTTHGDTSGLGLTTATWYHIAVVFDGTLTGNANRLKVFVNGVQKTLTFTGTIPATLLNSASAFELGRFQGLGRFLDGLLDEVAQWGRALTSAEILARYAAGTGIQWPFGTTSIPPEEVDGPYISFDLAAIPENPGICSDGFHRDPVSGLCVADDPTTASVTALQPLLRKRYTANFPITDSIRAIDVLYKILFPTFKGFLRVNKHGKYEIRSERPSDSTRIGTASVVGDTALQILDVLPWKTGPDLLAGRILIGSPLTTSEVRDVSNALYSTAGNAVTLTSSGTGTSTATASGASLSGGSTTVRANGTITVGGTPAPGNIIRAVISGVTVSYILTAQDTNQTAAAMLAAYINAIKRLSVFVEATWTASSPLVITLSAKHGTLNLSSALLKAHAIGVADPGTAPTVANTASGTLDAGIYKVAYTNVTALGETSPTPIASVTLTALHKIGVSGQPAFPAGVTSRNWYISVGPDSKTLRFVVNRVNNSDFNIDQLPEPEASLRPTENTTAEELIRVAMSLATNSQDVLPGWKSSIVTSVIPVVLNDIYLPDVLNGHKYKATSITTGITGASAPVWPLTAGGTVVDSGVTWTEFGETVLGQTGLTRANVLKDSYNWPMGSEQSSINQIKGTFIDRKNDFAKTELLVNDREHQLQVSKTYPLEVDLSAVDSFNQANRLCNSAIAKYRDGDWFNTMGTGPSALSFGMEEGDVICSSDDSGGLINVVTRIESLSISKDHQITINRARLYSTNMFSDDAEKHTIPIPTTLRYAGLADSIIEFIDNFAIRDADALVPGFYVAVSRDLTIPGEWRGWVLYADYGDGYVEIARGDSGAIMGDCTSTLGTPSDPSVFDRTNSVTFTLKFGPDTSVSGAAFASCTEAELASNSRRNLFLIGTEYVQAATIVDNGNQSFTISTLLRGRFGTDTPLHIAHVASEAAIYLNGAETFVAIDPVRLNGVYNYKAVTVNQDVADATPVSFTWTGGTVRPLAPVNLMATRNTAGDILFEWIRRSRIAPGMIPGSGTPMGEEVERDEVDIRSGGNVLRTLRVDRLTGISIPWVVDPVFGAGSVFYSPMTLRTLRSFVELTLSAGTSGGVTAGSAILNIYGGPYGTTPVWQIQLDVPAAGSAGFLLISDNPGTLTQYNQALAADGLTKTFKIRVEFTGDEALFYIDYINTGSIPIFRSHTKPVAYGFLSLAYQIGTPAASSVTNAVGNPGKPIAFYPVDLQTIDFGSAQSSVNVRVFQMSSIVGRGEYLDGTV